MGIAHLAFISLGIIWIAAILIGGPVILMVEDVRNACDKWRML